MAKIIMKAILFSVVFAFAVQAAEEACLIAINFSKKEARAFELEPCALAADLETDGDAPFRMVCDVLVKSGCRGGGVGNVLLKTAIEWLQRRGARDIYLESGKNNHAAHRFFEKRGFIHISEIYKLV